jgi:hypothetical protein
VAAQAGLRHVSVYGGIERKRFIIETNGCGVALLDYDGDGWLDALVLSGTRLRENSLEDERFPESDAPTNRLYRNNRDGSFSDVTDAAGLRRTGWASAVCAGDYDNDGRTDIFVTYFGTNVLYRNCGDGTFQDVTARSGLAAARERWGAGCTFIDYDRDGRLDLFVANYLRFDRGSAPEPGKSVNCMWKGIPVNCGPRGLPFDTNLLYRNRGDGTFEDVSGSSGIASVTGRYSMTAAAADFDKDGWTDIYVAGDSTASILYRNMRDGTFRDVAVETGVAFNEDGNKQAGMGLGIADFNGDGLLDILKTHFADDIPALYRAAPDGRYQDVAVEAGLAVMNRHVEWGAGMPDLDNDGRPDLVYVTGNVYPEVETHFKRYPHRGPRVVFRNAGDGRFELVTDRSGAGATEEHSSRGAAFGDIDNDGDVDILTMNMNEPPSLLRNDQRTSNSWIRISLEGTLANRSAIGAIVTVNSGGRRQARAVLSQSSYYSVDDLTLHFGLGTAERVDSVEVLWPGGETSVVRDVPARRVVRIKQ